VNNSTWRLVVVVAALLTVGATGFALGAGLASEPVSVSRPATSVAATSTTSAGTSTSTAPPALDADGQTSAPPSIAISTVAATPAGSALTGERVEITISNFAFVSADVSVPAGTTVVFVNEDEAVHNVLSDDGQLQSPDLERGGTYEVTLGQPGTIAYICNIHQFMQGTITVTP